MPTDKASSDVVRASTTCSHIITNTSSSAGATTKAEPVLETTAVDETTDHWRLPADSSRTHACLLQSCRSYRTIDPHPGTSSCSSEHRSHSTAVSTGGHTIHCTNMRTVKLDVIGEANQCCVAPGRAMNTSTRVSASIHVDTHRHTHRDTDTHTHVRRASTSASPIGTGSLGAHSQGIRPQPWYLRNTFMLPTLQRHN